MGPVNSRTSQAGVGKIININGDAYGRYERDEVKPTVDVIKKLADVLDTTISYLIDETNNKNAFKDSAMFKRISDIESLPEKDRECLLLTVDNFIKATKLNMI